jgi:hypothetical protein
LIVELAIFTRIPVGTWLAESDDVVHTAVRIMLERAQENVRQRKEQERKDKAAELAAKRRRRR